MTKGELLNVLAALPNDADIVLCVREWGQTISGDETYIGKYADLLDVEVEANEFGDVSVFLIGDND